MTEYRLALSLLVAVGLSACSLAPDYLRPAPPIAAQWSAQSQIAGARSIVNLDWKAFFPDPRMQGLIAAALDHNRDLRVAVGRVAEARALYGIQSAARLPNVDLSLGRNASRTPADVARQPRDVQSSSYAANLNLLAFELDFWGRVKSLSDAALASYLATDEARRAFRLSLIADVADAYLLLQELDERIVLAGETMRSREETRRLIALRRQVGIASDLDFLQADGTYEAARAELANLERQRATAANALVLLVGTVSADLPSARRLVEQAIPDLVAELPADVLLRRPDVLSAEHRLIAANANIGAARAAFLPRITLTGSFGSASPALSGLFASGTEAWTFQPAVRLPLFDAGNNAANLDLAEARKVIAVAQYEQSIQQAFREVADLLAARANLVEQLRAQQALEKSQSERLRLTEARYKGGVASHLELLDAQRDSFSAQQAAVQVRRQLLSAGARLYKALGGGDVRN
ncbi:MAG: efflux transporter outer membrane subunit [Rhodocyclaceae bacterium]|nr:efflux transporter outer membrane subunit [Rhodocyclaceae bacterium]